VDPLRPRAKTTNARTMTHLRRWGVADRLRAAAPLPVEEAQDVVFCSTLLGHEVRRFEHAFQLHSTRQEEFPEAGQQVPQPVIEEVLRAAVEASVHARLWTGARVSAVRQDDDGVDVTVTDADGGKPREVDSDVLLVAVGRRPLTADIGLEGIDGLRMERGYVVVDEFMRTGVDHLYAIGDIVPGYALAHVASHEAVVAVETIAGEHPEPVDMTLMPRVTFCRPQIASIGLSEADAAKAGREVKVGKFPFSALGKATIVGESEGFVKLVADAESDLLLGAHIIGPQAGDLLAEAALARLVEGTSGEIAMSVHAHPTLTEALVEAALAVRGAAIHI
jgi:dihydrolipoamide dehydrogenase